MLTIYFYTIASVMAVSILSLAGIFIFLPGRNGSNKVMLFLISLSAGALLGDSFLHLMPEAVEKNNNPKIWLCLLIGIMAFFILEKIIHWRHCHMQTSESHPHPVGMMNLVGDSLHNFIDGAIIAGSFLIDPKIGLATTIAVISHEIPQEIGDYAVLIYAGYSKTKALIYNFISASFAILGAIIALSISGKIENFTDFIIPFTAGGFIYIAMTDLFPELKKDSAKFSQTFLQLAGIIFGIGVMLALKKIAE